MLHINKPLVDIKTLGGLHHAVHALIHEHMENSHEDQMAREDFEQSTGNEWSEQLSHGIDCPYCNVLVALDNGIGYLKQISTIDKG